MWWGLFLALSCLPVALVIGAWISGRSARRVRWLRPLLVVLALVLLDLWIADVAFEPPLGPSPPMALALIFVNLLPVMMGIYRLTGFQPIGRYGARSYLASSGRRGSAPADDADLAGYHGD